MSRMYFFPVSVESRGKRRSVSRSGSQIESGHLCGIGVHNRFGAVCFPRRGKFPCPVQLSASDQVGDESAALVRRGFEEAEPNVLLLLPKCSNVTNLQTALIKSSREENGGVRTSPTHRLKYFVVIACNLLTNDKQG